MTAPVCEKNIEILFNRFFLQSFPLGSLEIFAPSSAEDFLEGESCMEKSTPVKHVFATVFKFSEFCTTSEFGVFIREKLR